MIIYDEKIKSGMIDFGIEIPVSKSKSEKAFNYLKNHKVLKKHIKNWHIDSVTETITKQDLLRVHSKDYVEKLFSDKLENEIIKSYELVDDKGNFKRYNPQNAVLPLKYLFDIVLKKAAGTYQCCLTGLNRGFSFFFSGGMHHAMQEYGQGFCMINDIVIAIKRLLHENKIKRAWVIDVDAHKGDGTASLTKNDDSIKTLSIHMANGWPLNQDEYDKNGNLNPSFIPSDIDIPVAENEEEFYNPRLKEGLNKLEETFQPDLALVVLGSDPYEKDELPSTKSIKLTLEQMMERDLLIYNFLSQRKIPQSYLTAGGYGESSWQVYAQFLEFVLLEKYKGSLKNAVF